MTLVLQSIKSIKSDTESQEYETKMYFYRREKLNRDDSGFALDWFIDWGVYSKMALSYQLGKANKDGAEVINNRG